MIRRYSYRDLLLLHPYQLPIVFGVAVVSVVFTIWPEALDHSPIAFEQRGIIHHVWHYMLLVGSLCTLYSMLWARPTHRLQVEVVGLSLMITALAINIIAFVTDVVGAAEADGSGLAVAVRSGVVVGMVVRLYILIQQPKIQVAIEPRRDR